MSVWCMSDCEMTVCWITTTSKKKVRAELCHQLVVHLLWFIDMIRSSCHTVRFWSYISDTVKILSQVVFGQIGPCSHFRLTRRLQLLYGELHEERPFRLGTQVNFPYAWTTPTWSSGKSCVMVWCVRRTPDLFFCAHHNCCCWVLSWPDYFCCVDRRDHTYVWTSSVRHSSLLHLVNAKLS